jgi:polysaccharide biosynthesis/export protein
MTSIRQTSHRMRGLVATLAALAAITLTGCGYNRNSSANIGVTALPVTEAPPVQRFGAVSGQLSYVLQPGDQFDVKLFYNPELNESVVVRPDGAIALQLVGEVRVAGRSPAELGEELTRRYAETLRRPSVAVIVRKYASRKVYVSGEVVNPGPVAIDGVPITVLEAIMSTGGFRPTAARNSVIILRQEGEAQPQFLKVDLQAHLEQTASQDLQLRPFDIVFVPQTEIAEVAQFFDLYINRIVSLYRNLGFSFNYDVNNVKIVQ